MKARTPTWRCWLCTPDSKGPWPTEVTSSAGYVEALGFGLHLLLFLCHGGYSGKAAPSGAGERAEAWMGNCLYVADLCKNSLFQGHSFLALSHSPSEFEKDGALICDIPELPPQADLFFSCGFFLLGWSSSVTLLGLDYPATKVSSGCEVLH